MHGLLLGIGMVCVSWGGSAGAAERTSVADTAVSGKIAPTLNAQWTAARGWVRRQQWVECLVKIDGRLEEEHAQQLRYAGFVSRSVLEHGTQSATLLTGHLRLTDLWRVARLPFVQVIEGAAVVRPKGAPVNVGK